MVPAYTRVGTSMPAADIQAAANFPATASSGVTGSVMSVSRLPLRISSEKRRMVSAGIKKAKRIGSIEKKFRSSARLIKKNVEKKRNPEKARKSAATM